MLLRVEGGSATQGRKYHEFRSKEAQRPKLERHQQAAEGNGSVKEKHVTKAGLDEGKKQKEGGVSQDKKGRE